MTSIIEKRLCLHRDLANRHQQNNILKYQISRLQALANIGTATCMIAHEINNLLAPLGSFAELALKNSDDKALGQKVLEKTVRNCERASKIMENMLAVVNGQKDEKQDARLLGLVEEIFSCLCRDFAKDGITVELRVPEDLTVWAVPVQIQQVLMNLILNARDAMLARGGILTIEAQERSDTVQIKVCDTGCGIEPAMLKDIFELFFTTKTNKESPSQDPGSGLGLAFCKKVIDAHDGSVSVESEPARGSTFKITLPKRQ